MLNAEKLRKISENAEKRRKARDQRSARKTSLLQGVRAKKIAQELIPEAEKKVERVARQGQDKVCVYYFQDSFGSLQREVARLIASHFSRNFRVSHFVNEEEGCYFGTDLVVHIR